MPFAVASILSPWRDAAFLHGQDPEPTSTDETRLREFSD